MIDHFLNPLKVLQSFTAETIDKVETIDEKVVFWTGKPENLRNQGKCNILKVHEQISELMGFCQKIRRKFSLFRRLQFRETATITCCCSRSLQLSREKSRDFTKKTEGKCNLPPLR